MKYRIAEKKDGLFDVEVNTVGTPLMGEGSRIWRSLNNDMSIERFSTYDEAREYLDSWIARLKEKDLKIENARTVVKIHYEVTNE